MNRLASKIVVSPHLTAPEAQRNPELVELAVLLKKVKYTAILNEMLEADMARVPCFHLYCSGSLQSRLDSSEINTEL